MCGVVESMLPFQNSFVGRQPEQAALSAALESLHAGRTQLFLISGEPGIGKTRLAEELGAVALSRNTRVVWGRCWEGGGAPAYWPWIQILRALVIEPSSAGDFSSGVPAEIAQLLPELSLEKNRRVTSDPMEARFRLFDAAASTLRELARRQPIVLIVDDLHDADQSSLEMLCFVARSLPDANILILATYRDAEVQRSPILAATLAELAREAPQLLLRGLSAREVATFVEDRTGVALRQPVADTIAHATAGNPLFLDGVVRNLVAEGRLEVSETLQPTDLRLPDSQRMAIAARLGRLSSDARAMLPYAAALGNEFELVALECVSAIPNLQLLKSIDELTAAGLMRLLSADRYRFAHALIRGSIYDDIGSSGRIALHQHIGEKLEELYRTNLSPHLAQLAHHFTFGAQGRDPHKAIDYSIRAAEAADRALAYNEAFALRHSALTILGERAGQERMRAFLLAEMGRVGGLSGRANGRDGITGYYEGAIEIYAALNDRAEEARARFNLGTQLAKGDDESYLNIPRARAELEKAEAAVLTMNDPVQLGRVRCALALAAWQALDPDAGLQACGKALEVKLDEFWWCTTSNFRAIHLLHAGRLGEAFQQFDRGAKQARIAKDPLARFRSAFHAGNLRVWSWQPESAMRELETSIVDLMLARGSLQHQMLSRLAGQAAAMLGDLERAREFVRDGPLPLLQGQLALYEGEWQQAREILTDGVTRMREAGARGPQAHYLFWLARVELASGKLTRAETLLREGAEIASAAHSPLFEMWFRPELAWACARNDRLPEARRNLERCAEIVSGGEQWFALVGLLARARGEIAAREGNWEAAETALQNAIGIFREYHMPWEEALTHEAWARFAMHRGDTENTAHHVDAAQTIYRAHGAGQAWTAPLQGIREKRRAAVAVTTSSGPASIALKLQRDGDIWTISHRERTFRIKDSKGLRYIAHLLEHPGEEFHVLDLIRSIEGVANSDSSERLDELRVTHDLGDAGEILDARSKTEYRRRREELRAELEEATPNNDRGRIERIRAELEMLEEQLVSAMGLGGRDRKAADHSERARDRIRKSIQKSLTSIRENDPSLGHHLTTCIRTGYICAYVPDPAGR